MKVRFLLLISFLVFAFQVQSQVLTPSRWSFELSKSKVKLGETLDLIFKVKIEKGWHMYSNDFDPKIGPKPAEIKFTPNPAYKLVGKTVPIGAHEIFDEIFEGKVRLFDNKAEFRQKVKILAPITKIEGTYMCQTCSDAIGKCIDQDDEFSFGPITVEAKAEASSPPNTEPATPEAQVSTAGSGTSDSLSASNSPSDSAIGQTKQADTNQTVSTQTATTAPVNLAAEGTESESLWGFFLAAFVFGLGALITPCVFPMIPMTVTFFTRQSKSRKEAIGKGVAYSLSIVGLYVLIGTVVSRFNGPEFANFMSTHWAPNLFFFAIFIFFGLSFLGLFEIVLPSSLVNMADRESDKGGLYGIFFMAFTIVLVSFSCTGPIVGSILVQSAGGVVIKPIVGMLGYSLAFALPFGLFAIFPQWLNSLPKSGGWLNSVKVFLGFLELAFALKFFSIPDLAYHWGILDRDIYLAIWIVIAFLTGYYLLGKIRMPHDSPMEKVPVLRLLLAIGVFSFGVYLIPGLWGAPLKALSGYLPPLHTQEFRMGAAAAEAQPENSLCETPRFNDLFHLPEGLQGYYDLKQAQACAKKQNKPIFIDFTGHGCTNCREMENRVWVDPEVKKRLQNDFIIASLYCDDKTELPEKEWYTSKYDGKVKKTIGKQNTDLQVTQFQNNAQPLYVIMDPDGNVLVQPRGHNIDVAAYVKFLDEGKKAMSSRP